MSGTLKIGDSIVVGQCHGKIKAMTDYTGERMNAAGPSTPVEVLGLNEVPSAGDRIIVAADERAARNLAEERAMKARSKQLDGGRRRMSLKDLRKHLDDGEMRSLNLVVKADVQGSVEAVKGLLEKVANEEVEVKVVAANVGSITESDVLLASASDAIIVGFNAKPEGKAKAEAEKHRVEIRTYSIIYELIEDIEAAVKGMLAPKFEEQARGSAEIRAVFKLTKAGFVAGSYVTEGTLKRGGECRVFRNKELVYTGKVDSLKHIKADVREMNMGQECGIQFDGWTAFQEGDIVEAFEMVQIMD
jgi:translation initiation factor IF-2